MGGARRRRQRVELGLAVITGGLSVVTLVWPEWIEALFRVEPDAGSGAAEWAIVFGLLLLAVMLGVSGSLGVRHRHRLRDERRFDRDLS
jgi:hypothetical protein